MLFVKKIILLKELRCFIVNTLFFTFNYNEIQL